MSHIRDVYGLACIYCGEPATDRDHVVPHSLVKSTRVDRTYTEYEVVPACRDCNGALHNRPLLTIPERAKWLHTRLVKKLAKVSSTWTPEEIEALGSTLRGYVVKKQTERAILEQRCTHAGAVAKCAELDPASYWQAKLA